MKCPFCAVTETKVVDKRPTPDGEMNRRRRECLRCKKRFTTYEQIERLGLVVIKKDGSTENFDRQKVKDGLVKACEKRPIPEDKINSIVDWIEQKAMRSSSKKIKSNYIGELTMKKLKTLDSVAYLRFASVFYSFNDITSFEKELKIIRRG